MNRTLLFYFLITIMPLFSITCLAQPVSSPPASPFEPSELQQNGAKILDLETKAKSYMTDKEIIDLKFNLHLINFDGSKVNNPQQQFMVDFARIYCHPEHASNLPECNRANDDTTPQTFAIFRPSNIFKTNYQRFDLLFNPTMAKTIVNPFPNNKFNEMLNDPKTLQDPEKQEELANAISPQASLMLAQNTFNEIMSKRIPEGSDPSIMQTIFDESTRRLTNPEWIEKISDLPTDQLLMELLQLEAFRMWVEYHKFTQNERIEALLAALLSKQATGGAVAAIAEDLKKEQQQGEDKAKEIEQESQGFMNPSF